MQDTLRTGEDRSNEKKIQPVAGSSASIKVRPASLFVFDDREVAARFTTEDRLFILRVVGESVKYFESTASSSVA
jgi:hypothetical protein